MTLPANIRVNVAAPFPALVQGSGPITIAKSNGIWTVGFTIAAFGSQNPPIGNYPTDFVLAWDSVAQTFFKMSLTNLLAAVTGARNQRSVTATPIVIASTDMILNCNISSGPAACTLPAAVSRAGVPLTFVDVGAQFGTFPLTITPNGAETINGAANLVLNTPRRVATLVPANDGTNTGWNIQ